jgi:hypothetical protein
MSDPSRPTEIRINFVDRQGKPVEELLVRIDETSSELEPNVEAKIHDCDDAIREFRLALEGKHNSDNLERIVYALDRLDCWQAALRQLLDSPGPNETLGTALLGVWTHYGLNHIGASLNGDPILLDALKHLLPLHKGPGVRLYRGEIKSRC